MLKRVVTILLLAAFAPEAWAQFETPPSTPVMWRVGGLLLSESGAPAPQPGDEIAALYQGQVVGVFRFTSGSISSGPRDYSMVIYGNDPRTPGKEGPDPNEIITFAYFEANTGMERQDIAPINQSGQSVLLRYNGIDVSEFEGFPPFLIEIILGAGTELNLVLGREPSAGGGDGDGGDSGPTFDVNGDGVVDKRDAAMVLRVITGNTRELTQNQIRRADVNRDGVVNTRDVVAVLRAVNETRIPASARDAAMNAARER